MIFGMAAAARNLLILLHRLNVFGRKQVAELRYFDTGAGEDVSARMRWWFNWGVDSDCGFCTHDNRAWVVSEHSKWYVKVMHIIDLTGQEIGYWTVLEQAGTTPSGQTLWRCRCKCGTEKVVIGIVLRDKRSQSCGCLKREVTAERSTTHGHTLLGKQSPTYQTWADMLRRCRDPNRPEYHRYGGRGIKVCKRWHKFANFLTDMGEKPHKLTIDRINNDGNYEPRNCRWATRAEQVHKISFARWQEEKAAKAKLRSKGSHQNLRLRSRKPRS